MGALTGGLGFCVLATMLALWTALRSGKEVHDNILTYLQQFAAHSSDPRMQQLLDLLNTPEGFAFFIILTLVMTLVAFLIFSTLGGAIGAFLLNRKERL
jgi:ABC-type transport system involved in multi-copper enzyme maturation permease subunit